MSTGWATHSHSLTPPPWLPAAVSHSRRRLRPKIDKKVDDVKDRGRKLRQRGERHCCSQGNTNSWNHKNVSHQSDVCFANWCLSSWSHSHLRYEVFVKWYLCSMNLTPKAILGWLFRLKFKAVLPSKVFQHQRRFFFPTDCFKPYIKVKISQERSFGQSSLPEPPASPEAAGHMTRPRDWNVGQIPGWRRIYIALFGRKFNSKNFNFDNCNAHRELFSDQITVPGWNGRILHSRQSTSDANEYWKMSLQNHHKLSTKIHEVHPYGVMKDEQSQSHLIRIAREKKSIHQVLREIKNHKQ